MIGKNYEKQKEKYEASNYDETALSDFKSNTYFIFGLSNFLSKVSEDKKEFFHKFFIYIVLLNINIP